jgi:hypothetical protein
MRTLLFVSFAAASGFALSSGCAASSGDSPAGPGPADGTGGLGDASGGGGIVTAGGGGAGGDLSLGGFGGNAPEPIAEVFGESADTLYRLDPDTKQVTVVGPFVGCDGVLDIALDKDGLEIIATTFDGIYRVDKTTAACTLISSGSYPNSLSFVPAGTVDPNAEALVGYNFSTYVRIDPTSGVVSPIGGLSGGLASSGDIVSVKDGKTFLTVTGPSCDDCLVEVNPATGDVIKNWGGLGFDNVFGIAFWAGSVYGFTSHGELFEITFDGGVLQTASIPMTPGLSFWGAGSTTSAPPIPIPD